MSSSNYRRNEAAIRKFRKELMDMVDDIREIDKRVLNQAVNEGVAYAKRRTPVGAHPNPVVLPSGTALKWVRLSALRFLALVWEENSGKAGISCRPDALQAPWRRRWSITWSMRPIGIMDTGLLRKRTARQKVL